MASKIVGRFTDSRREGMRIINRRFELNHFDIDLSDYEVSHYGLGDRFAQSHITKEHFDSISVVCLSECPKKRSKHVHAIGYRSKENKSSFLVLTKTTPENEN